MLFWRNQWDLKARMSFADLDVLARVGDKYLTELFHTSVSFYVNDPRKNKPWGLGYKPGFERCYTLPPWLDSAVIPPAGASDHAHKQI